MNFLKLVVLKDEFLRNAQHKIVFVFFSIGQFCRSSVALTLKMSPELLQNISWHVIAHIMMKTFYFCYRSRESLI